MAIVVEEGLHPNGMDLVKEARLNHVARANAEPQREVRSIQIGDSLAIIGLSIEPLVSFESGDQEQALCAVLSIIGGRHSDLVPMKPVKLIIGELGRVPLSKLREMLTRAIDGEKPAVEQ